MDDQLGPPESAGADQVAAAQGVVRFRSAALRSWVAMGALGFIALVDLVDIVHQSRFAGLVDDYVAGRTTSGSLLAYDSFTVSLAWLYLAIFVACGVGFVAWLSRAVENAPAISPGRPPRGSRGAIGWWFAPIANWWVPYQIVTDLDRRLALAPARGAGRYLLPAWWLAWVSANLSASVPRLFQSAETVEGLKLGVTLGTISSAINLAAALLAVAVVARIQGHEDARRAGATPSDGSVVEAPGPTA